MKPVALAWRSLIRQPARAALGVAGIAVVGALLFDMLLLSHGLAVSFRELLEGMDFDVRVTAGQFVPSRGPRIRDGTSAASVVRGLPEIENAVSLRFGRAEILLPRGGHVTSGFMGISGPARGIWTVVEGRDLALEAVRTPPAILINRALAERLDVPAGGSLRLRGSCDVRESAMPPVEFEVAGIVEFRFDVAGEYSTVTAMSHLLRACEPADPDAVTMILADSSAAAGPDGAAKAIRRSLPDLHAYTNQEFVDRLQVTDFSYFRQISFALTVITLLFSFLLIATLLTVSVNQRLAEVAALRALGFRRGRVVADLLWESCLLVGSGGLLGLPLGALVAVRLDAILREMPGIPMSLHFFVFQPRAAVAYTALLAVAGGLAAAYPLYLVARLPIAATLRREAP